MSFDWLRLLALGSVVVLGGCNAITDLASYQKCADNCASTDGSPSADASSDTSTDTSADAGSDVNAAACALIDDLESGDAKLPATCGRYGYWHVFNDGVGTQVPAAGEVTSTSEIPGGRGASTRAIHTSGSGFTTWGAGIGFFLQSSGGTKKTYDASTWSGFTFFARAAAPIDVGVNVSTSQTDASQGICTPIDKCGDDYGTFIRVGTDWAPYTVSFDTLRQQGWGYPLATFDARTVVAIGFQLDKGVDFDLWIDDLSFIGP